MPITLATPQATTISNYAIVHVGIDPAPSDATPATWRIVYGPSDVSGNLLPGSAFGLSTAVLNPADVVLFFTTPGTVRVRAQAALQNNLGAALAGAST